MKIPWEQKFTRRLNTNKSVRQHAKKDAISTKILKRNRATNFVEWDNPEQWEVRYKNVKQGWVHMFLMLESV